MSNALKALERSAAARGLRELFPPKPGPRDSFCILDFDNVCKLLGVAVTSRERLVLRQFHCVKYHDMTAEERDGLLEACRDILTRDPVALPSFAVGENGIAMIAPLDGVRPLELMPYKARS